MRTLPLALLVLASVVSAQDVPSDVDHLIGRPYAGLPGGWGGVGGAVLESSPDGETYLLSEFESVHDGSHLFVYSRVDQMVDGRYPVSTVLAALVVADVREGEIASSFACTFGRSTPAVVVAGEERLVETGEPFRYGPVRLAWRLDRPGTRFEPVAPASVTCAEEEVP